ncbi:MAG: SWIM zinc finger family protein [Proteobacteria bacterium]|nr:SWIM zinc finger family protein [Pseudomonadota bacterium]
MIAPLRQQERTMLLADVLTLDNLRLYAGDKTFIRGRDYFNSGAVQALESNESSASAEVLGTQRYEIVLSAGADGELEFECDCPVGEDGIFCKHAVAVGLAWIAGEDLAEPETCSPKPKSTRQSKAVRLRAYVDGLSPGELRRWLLQAAEQDHDLRDRLLFAAAAQAAHDLPGLRSAIHQATRISGFLDHDDTEAHANRLQDLAGLLETRIADGDAKLVELVEEAIGLIQNGLENIDDGEGWVYGSLERFQQLHLLACEHLRPDATALAERLVRYQMDSHWDTFSTILPDYGNALGEVGVERYRTQILMRWAQLPALTPQDNRTARFDPKRSRLEKAMETLARASGNIDEMIQVLRHNLSSSQHFQYLASYLAEHGRFDEALACAEEGLAAFPAQQAWELVDFCIHEYRRRGAFDQVEEFAWKRFLSGADQASYAVLLKEAGSIGRRAPLRARALQHLWDQVAKEEAKPRKQSPAWLRSARSELVAIHIMERDAEAAWSTFQGGHVAITLWGKVAALRAGSHPEDAIALYFRLLPHAVEEGSRGAKYDDAFAVVAAIRKLRLSGGQHAVFDAELGRVRLQYKAKRNFMKRLAEFQ